MSVRSLMAYASNSGIAVAGTLPFATVAQYGAAGNGTTDDTAAFTAALAAAQVVYVPQATYKISSTLTIGENQILFGPGVINYAGTGNCIQMTGDRCAVVGLQINGTSSAGDGIYVNAAHNWLIDFVQVTGFTNASISGRTNGGAAGVSLDGAYLGTLRDSRLTGNNVGLFFLGNDGGSSGVSNSVVIGPRNHIFGNYTWNVVMDGSVCVRLGGEFSIQQNSDNSWPKGSLFINGSSDVVIENPYFENNTNAWPSTQVDFVQFTGGGLGLTLINPFFNGQYTGTPANIRGLYSFGASSEQSVTIIDGDFRQLVTGVQQAATSGGQQSSLMMVGEAQFFGVATAVIGTPIIQTSRTGWSNAFNMLGDNGIYFANPGGSTGFWWGTLAGGYIGHINNVGDGTGLQVVGGNGTTGEPLTLEAQLGNVVINAGGASSEVSWQVNGSELAELDATHGLNLKNGVALSVAGTEILDSSRDLINLNEIQCAGPASIGGSATVAGSLTVTGSLTKGSGSFKIDHPLDPANRYLSHSFVESPDMMNIYNGNAATDEKGQAVVELPAYFEALNRDFRYQLTVLGQFAQAMIAEEVRSCRFTIKTDKPHVRVSWQVTGIRKDRYAEAHPIQVEEDKPHAERGRYLHSDLYGGPGRRPRSLRALGRNMAPKRRVGQ